MILMQLRNIVKAFGAEVILNGINLEVQDRDRIAIVGRNGAGKSTLLKVMIEELGYEAGEMQVAKDIQIGYLAQHNDIHSRRTIWEEMLTVFADLIAEEKALEELAVQIEENSHAGTLDEKLMNEYSRRQEDFADHGGYRFKSDAKGVLIGLGFPEEDFKMRINDLSGGQKTRLALGKLLLTKPEVLILDEPTNHLDIPTLTWLENYLLNYDGAILIVSHDRYFLDKLVNIVYEITYKKAFKYHGSYSQFLAEKAKNYDRDMKMFEKQQKEIKEMEDFVARNIARASTTKRAQSRRRQLEKMEVMDRPLGDESRASFSFEVNKTSGNDVLTVADYTFSYDNALPPIFSDISFQLHRGDRIALIGENGVGKTTLLKNILKESSDAITLGTNVQIGYYAQEQEKLTPANTILQEVWDTFPNKLEKDIRTVLGNFLFSGDDVLKTISQLSGGEKARVALAKLMLKQANFLILDEPTNHLDLASKEILEAALLDYTGTILFVSHDRYFINKIADKIFELKKDAMTVYLGNYDYYIEKTLEQAAIDKLEAAANIEETPEKDPQLSFQEQKRLQSEQRKIARRITKIEDDIETLELKLEAKREEMTDPDLFKDHEKLLALTKETDNMQAEIDTLMEEWERLQIE